MKHRCCQLGLASILGIGSAIASIDCAIAQVVPDATLGGESSVVTTTPSSNVDLIQGGATRGANLFHSFEQFSVLTGREARFENALDIQNIISRVTGSSISNINGFIRTNGNGTANLFLINPNGITFGPNASLDINGSFVGSTASSVSFADGTVFSATAPQPTPLLTISVPVGLQFGETRGSIVNQSRATNGNGQRGFRVQPGKTLALVGGNVSLDGGVLRTEGGRVELAGVAEPATVGLNIDSNNLSLSFFEGVRLADVSLTNGAVVNVSAINSGSIAITAGNINISGESALRANRQAGSGSVNTQTGDITLNATELITVANSSEIVSNVLVGAVGNGGSINITTGSLLVNDGARLESNIMDRGQGDAGNVTINAREAVSFDGVGSNESLSGAFSRVELGAVGNGGDINITTGVLSVANGARLVVNTLGRGNAGKVTILARDTISLYGVGISRNTSLASGVFSEVERTAVGNGGDINITTGSLFATNGTRLNTNSDGQGNAGSVTINARDTVSFDGVVRNNSGGVFSRVEDESVGNGGDVNVTTGSLFATNGARLTAESTGQGNAGDIAINARDRVFLDGVGSNGNLSGVFSGASLPPSNSSIIESSPGQGGNLTIKTGQLVVQNGAEVNVTSERAGIAGEIRVEADSIELSNRGNIKAEALLSQGGNIDLQVRDVILMRRQGLISATAGGTGNGGNVTIGNATNAPLVVAFPAEDSDIIAQASEGQGGNIRIFTQGIFGLEARNPTTPQSSDINASSDVGIDGTVAINRLDIDPSQGLVALPSELVDVSNQIAAGCAAGSESIAKNEFIITGRGGLPPSPTEPLSGEAVLTPWATLEPEVEGSSAAPATRVAAPNQIVEANGWAIAANGQVILTASAPNSPNTGLIPTSCNGS